MRINSKALSVSQKLIIAAAALCGVAIQTGTFTGFSNLSAFRMFTVLSNTLCAAYFLPAAVTIALSKNRDGGDSPLPFLKGICTMCISLTGIVAAAVLMQTVNFTSVAGISAFILHIATPVLTISDWLLFDKKGRYGQWMPAAWTAAPLVYFVYIMVSADLPYVNPKNRYPYPFLDYEHMGMNAYLTAIAIITAVYVLFGYLIRFIDQKAVIEYSSKAQNEAGEI